MIASDHQGAHLNCSPSPSPSLRPEAQMEQRFQSGLGTTEPGATKGVKTSRLESLVETLIFNVWLNLAFFSKRPSMRAESSFARRWRQARLARLRRMFAR